MKKTLTTLTLLIIVAAIHTQPLTTTATYTVSDSTKVMQLISTARRTPDDSKQFLNIAKQFIGTPYVAHTLDQSQTERLVVNISQVDCTTYLEYALAIHLCIKNKKYTFRDFCHYLAHIRYANGKISYATRNHYFTLWINHNATNHKRQLYDHTQPAIPIAQKQPRAENTDTQTPAKHKPPAIPIHTKSQHTQHSTAAKHHQRRRHNSNSNTEKRTRHSTPRYRPVEKRRAAPPQRIINTQESHHRTHDTQTIPLQTQNTPWNKSHKSIVKKEILS